MNDGNNDVIQGTLDMLILKIRTQKGPTKFTPLPPLRRLDLSKVPCLRQKRGKMAAANIAYNTKWGGHHLLLFQVL
jgi:hypothetical protein